MPRYQHQIVAQLRGIEADAKSRLDELQGMLRVGGDRNPLTGLDRTHQPRTDQDEQPAQRRLVQLTTAALLGHYATAAEQLFDLQCIRETGNTVAAAPVEVDGQEILPVVPVGFLLFIEDQLKTLLTGVIARLQARDPAEDWHRDAGDPPGVWRSAPRETLSTTKRPVAHVGVNPTEFQPAIVEWRDTDVVTGRWTWVHYSGQLSLSEIYAIRDRASKLLAAVRAAREKANRIEVEDQHVGAQVLGYVFGDLIA